MNPILRCVRLGAFSCASMVLLQSVAAQTTVSVPCNIDNTLYEDVAGGLSNGAGVGVFVGQTSTGRIRRAVLRFDVAAAVPAGAKVVAASLNLFVAQSTDFQDLPTDAHRVTQSWGEGTSVAGMGGGGGAASTTGDATWLHRFFNSSTWTSAGGDFVPAVSFSVALPLNGAVTATPVPGLVADVQSWIDAPATNFGWLLKATTEAAASTARRVDSSESSNQPPVLSVTYLLPSQTATWGTGCPSPLGTYSFSFTGAMIAGNSVGLLHTAGPANGIGANYFAVELNQPGALLYPSCSAYLPLSGNWIFWTAFLFDNAGVSFTPFTVPSGFPGLFFMSQSLALEATAPLGLTLSNAGVAVIQ